MRKILSKEEEEKKRKRNNTILVIVLGAVMVLGTLGYAIQGAGNYTTTGSSSEVDYRGFKFINQNGFWYLGNFTFSNTPPDIIQANQTTSNISISISPLSSYQGFPVYIYSEDPSAQAEATTNLGLVAQRIQNACPSDRNCSDLGDIPVKTCTDKFIIIETGNTSSITQDSGCVFIRGQRQDLVALTDQWLFKTLGVM